MSEVRGGNCRLPYIVEPVVVFRLAPASGSKKDCLNLFGDWTTRACADLLVIDFTDRRHLSGCACEESFVGRQQVFEMDWTNVNRVAKIVCDPDDGVAGYAEQDG